ncbi:cytochrome P450 [Mycobacterium paraseoulense]|uniref:cytochrome P450 n=1 Tax=Mycobacterium paraseoulense TaxID=590652 RepID=UPI0011521870|nr:cytochrome P450 [Mycobacterium paraseoulense]MCV7397252.1 cytochrome P450 [Mycobacterium paraseoulense]BBZ69856.1 putative cytochrome P450 143 [Mycobacterium paraseoulense]
MSVPAQVRPGIDHLSPIGDKLLPDFFTEDRSELWDALRKRGPVVLIEDGVFMNGYCLTRADDVLAALRNPEVFSLNALDRPDHARWRAILQPLLSSRAVKEMQPALQDQAAAVVEAVAAQGSCEVIADVAEPFAAQVLLTVLGLPPQDGDRLLRWEKALWAIQRAPLTVEGVRFEDVVQKVEMLAYLAEAFAQRRASPDIAGVMSGLVAGDDGFDDADACAVVEMLIAAGITPFRSAVGFVFLDLARDPRLCASLRENPAGIEGFVEDVLRREPPAPMIIRRAAQNVTVAGVEIPAGARVGLCVGAAIQEDIADGHGSRADYWAFGGGPHRCVAVSLAKTALTVLVGEWLRTIPAFGLDAESVPPVILEDAVRLSSLPLRWH